MRKNNWIFPLLTLCVAIIIFGISFFNNSSQVLVSKTQEPVIVPSVTASPSSSIETQISTAAQITVKVVKVIDGDTIQVSLNGKTETLRLIGIDTPETVDPRKPVQCFGKEASDKAKSFLAGKNVTLEADPTQGEVDKYGRLLRYIFMEDGTSFNKLMISEGYAHEYTYSLPYKYQVEYKQAERDARDNNRGLWADGACVATSSAPTQAVSNGQYACDCKKLCSQIKTCDEAYYQLNNCGCTKRDADSDGIPCESLCK